MEKKMKALLMAALAFSATMYFFYNFESERAKTYNQNYLNLSNSTDACIPDPEYFIDCMNHDEKRFNTTLKVHNKTIFVENVSFNDHLEIWEEVLNGFPPHITEKIIRIEFNATMMSNTSMMEMHYEVYPKIFCGPSWTYLNCLLDTIKVRKNIWTTYGPSRTYYKTIIAHEVGHSIRLNYSDRNLFEHFYKMNGISDIFITKYAMISNRTDARFGENEDFADNIMFWRGNTVLFWKISKRNEVTQAKFEIVARQMCYSKDAGTTLCPIYISRNATINPPHYYNGSTNNYKGLFEKDLKRSDIIINKNIANLSFEDLNSIMQNLENNGT